MKEHTGFRTTAFAVMVIGLVLAGAVREAKADIIVEFNSITGVGPYTWRYDGTVSSGEGISSLGLVPGPTTNGGTGAPSNAYKDYFTIYDFAGFTGAHSEPTDWVFEALPTGSTPSNVTPTSDTAMLNLTWYYTGAEILGPGSLGMFTAGSLYNQINRFGEYAASATNRTTNADGTPTTVNGTTDNKITSLALPAVPEPSSMLLLGTGLLGVARAVRRRRTQKA